DLLEARTPAGHRVGELSSSSLSTATAVSALAIVDREMNSSRFRELVRRGLEYLIGRQNPDGGWGDTDKSRSNIATTMLVRAAFRLGLPQEQASERIRRATAYIDTQGGLDGLRRRYGKDKTFAVPILTNCALAGLAPWREVAPLPFELACLPHAVLGAIRLPVVSYAIPALVAIGQARYLHRKPLNPITRFIRGRSIPKSLEVLRRMQPESGGFLEATPLTSFVVMSLAGTGRWDHPVVRRGVDFLVASAREDGSWPIDTNLATWVTTLATNALAASGEAVPTESLEWLLACQHRRVHPYTNAAPGGWAWTDLSGGVPDADDTPGALLALGAIRSAAPANDAAQIDSAAAFAVGWLLNLQNADGGWPTFCRGWGALPFDRSGVDLTAHVLRALHAWRNRLAARREDIARAIRRGREYLDRQQRPDGSWVPLWFGNQDCVNEENPVYGTARVLLAYADLGLWGCGPARRGYFWLLRNQQPDGGWGSAATPFGEVPGHMSSVEETAVALEALVSVWPDPAMQPAIGQGLSWLIAAVRSGRHRETAPIGFYFAKLWYYERLYPLIFTVAALGRAVRRMLPGLPLEVSHPDYDTA
ncbi:MAG: squalene--hopene cyclase, partial [Pirellulales bacterium]|nr:squalene--hopene cyclase [Pirellulales bacterium]